MYKQIIIARKDLNMSIWITTHPLMLHRIYLKRISL
jgi:hypothetical protein